MFPADLHAMIDLSHLTKTFAGKTAVDRLSFRASPGEVLGVLGPNGAGKSTSMRMLGGTLLPTSGTASVHGLDIRRQRRQAQRLIGYVPEGMSGQNDMSVRGFLGYIAQVRGYRGALERQRVGAMLDLFELDAVGQQRIATLSKGYRRRVDLAQALLHDPKVLLLDEPTDGLDPAQRHHVRELIKYWAQSKTVLLSTHLLEEVSTVCNRVVVINDGQLLADSTPGELESRSRYHQAVTLTSSRPLDMLALAVLPGVAGIEHGREPHAITVLAKPGATILAGIDQLIARSGWPVSQRVVERGRLEEIFRRLIQEQRA
ncbi:ABC transporter ATP-binding protein [Pseudomonas chlororaphis]|uniref:ABC transporter ATP-binding protein n=2 Tax=Pseudomonas TaxID=286 RepID=A0A0D5XZ76_9PSED|nr:ABC transporter ATP-binding protein [Pseudomonas chlororaphis]